MATKVFSRQDKDITEVSKLTSRIQEYKDIDLSFTAKPNGELYTKKDASAVVQALKNLIQTNYYEKPFEPFFGGNVRGLLFELADEDIEIEVKEAIIQTINEYEPRAKIINIFVNFIEDYNDLNVTIEFQVINTEEVVQFTTSLSRLR
jgi:phage baseplate assembly protein W